MAENGGEIRSTWSLDKTGLETGIKSVQGAIGGAVQFFGNFGNIISGVRDGLGLLKGAFDTVAGAITAVVKPAAEFQTKIQEIKSLGVDKNVAAIGEEIDQLTMKFGQESQDVIKGYYDAISAGVEEEKVTAFLESAAKLATVGVTDIGTAVDALTSTLNAYGVSADQSTQFSDALFAAVQKGKTTVPELAEAIGRVAPTASAMGISIQELTATIATMTSQGIKTSEATSGLKAALANVIKPTADADEAMKFLNTTINSTLSPSEKMALGIGEGGLKFDALTVKSQGLNGALLPVIQAIEAVKGGMEKQIEAAGGLNKVSEETRTKYAAIDGTISSLFGSIEGYNSVIALAAGGGEVWNTNLQALKTSTGEVDEQFQSFAETAGFKSAQLSASWATLKKDAGELFLGVLGQAAGVITPIVKAVDDWIGANREIIEQNLAKWFESMTKAINSAWDKYLKPAWEWINKFISGDMSEWGKVGDKVSTAMSGAWDRLKAGISQAWAAISPIFESINQWVKKEFGGWAGLTGEIVDLIVVAFSELWTVVEQVFKSAWDMVKYEWETIIKPFFEWMDKNVQLMGGWKMVFLAFKDAVKITFSLVSEIIKTFFDFGKTTFDLLRIIFDTAFTAIGVIIDLFRGDTDAALEKVKGYWTRFKEAIFGIFNRFKETFESWKDWYVGVLKRLGIESKEAMGESYIPDAWEAGRVHLARIWDAITEKLGGFYDQYKNIISAVAKETADRLTEQRLAWIKAFADQNDIWNKGITAFELAMTRFGHGNDKFLEKVKGDLSALVEYQRTGNVRSTQLWEDLFNASQVNIGKMSDRFGYLSEQAYKLWGIELPTTMAQGASDFSYYMGEMANSAANGRGVFEPLIEAINELKAILKELKDALDEAVGHSWFVDAMKKFKASVQEHFVTAMQDIDFFADVGVKGLDRLKVPLDAMTPEQVTSTTTTNNNSGNVINVNNPSYPVNAQSLPTGYTAQMVGAEAAKGFLRGLREAYGV